MKLKEIFDQSDTIIEPWPDIEANCFRVGGPCRSAFKQGQNYFVVPWYSNSQDIKFKEKCKVARSTQLIYYNLFMLR